MKRYMPRKGARLSKKDAQIVGQRIEFLTSSRGKEVSPLDVVEDAKAVRSPLHRFFQWDDNEAAQQWRLQQARVLMGAIVEVVVVKGIRKEQRSFFNVTNTKGEDVYVTLEKMVKTPMYLEQLIREVQEKIRSLNDTLQILSIEYRKAVK